MGRGGFPSGLVRACGRGRVGRVTCASRSSTDVPADQHGEPQQARAGHRRDRELGQPLGDAARARVEGLGSHGVTWGHMGSHGVTWAMPHELEYKDWVAGGQGVSARGSGRGSGGRRARARSCGVTWGHMGHGVTWGM
eukprot:2547466-Prymnesium_polylepis.1